MTRLHILVAAAAVLAAGPVLAGTPVDLRNGAVGHAGVVTLGDLFDGASGPAAQVVVAHAAPGTQAVLDAGRVELAAHAAGLDWDNASGQRRIIVSVTADAAAETTPRHVRRRRAEQALVYARNLMAGELIQASDLEWSDEAATGPGALHDPEAVIGKAARMPLHAGAPIEPNDLVNPKVIHRGDIISVDFADEGVTLSLEAKAQGDAAVGDMVEVVNTSSKKIIQAVATAPGHAAVGPGADAARASVFRTAALPYP